MVSSQKINTTSTASSTVFYHLGRITFYQRQPPLVHSPFPCCCLFTVGSPWRISHYLTILIDLFSRYQRDYYAEDLYRETCLCAAVIIGRTGKNNKNNWAFCLSITFLNVFSPCNDPFKLSRIAVRHFCGKTLKPYIPPAPSASTPTIPSLIPC